MIEDIFKQNNVKMTKSRKKIYQTILNCDNNCNFKYILDKCENDINKVTIYRVLEYFLKKNIIIKKLSIDNEIYYEINSQKHIHFLKCIKCNKKIEIPNKIIDDFEKKISTNNQIISHSIEFYVLCSKCKKI